MERQKYRLIVPFLLPALLLYSLFVVYPALRSMWVSLHFWRGLSANMQFVGLFNFQKMIEDEIFWTALGHNLIYLATYLFRAAFVQSAFGYATAIAVTLFAIKFVFSALTLTLTRRERLEY